MNKNKLKYNKGEIGMLLLMVIIGLFIIWVLTGGAKKEEPAKPFITPYTDTENPGETYDIGER